MNEMYPVYKGMLDPIIASPEIIEVKFRYRQTDKFFDTIYGGGFFLQVKFATSLIALLAGDK